MRYDVCQKTDRLWTTERPPDAYLFFPGCTTSSYHRTYTDRQYRYMSQLCCTPYRRIMLSRYVTHTGNGSGWDVGGRTSLALSRHVEADCCVRCASWREKQQNTMQRVEGAGLQASSGFGRIASLTTQSGFKRSRLCHESAGNCVWCWLGVDIRS